MKVKKAHTKKERRKIIEERKSLLFREAQSKKDKEIDRIKTLEYRRLNPCEFSPDCEGD